MNLRSFFILVLISFALVGHLEAMTLKQYKKYHSSSSKEEIKLSIREVLDIHVHAMGPGMQWLRGYMQASGQKPLFCPPGKLKFDKNIYHQAIQEGMKGSEESSEVGMAMAKGLRQIFPCK